LIDTDFIEEKKINSIDEIEINLKQWQLFNTSTTKKKEGQFVPVGEEDLVAVIKTNDGYVTILVDSEGYTKAQSKPLDKDAAMEIFKKARESGIEEFVGNKVEIWTEQYPTVQNELK